MLWGMRDPRTSTTRRRGVFRPVGDRLESRQLLAIDLATVDTTPYGVLLAGVTGSSNSGYSVAALGDVNGDGFDDFAVGSPAITAAGTNSQAFVVFGSRSVTAGTVDWRSLIAQQRVGNLSEFGIGQTNQTNPLNGQPGFNYSGLIFTSSLNPNAQLGASVSSAGDVNGDGFDDILIGAPGSADFNGANFGTGRAYLVYGGTNLNRTLAQGSVIDLDNLPAGINVITFANTGVGASTFATGTAVAGVGDVITDGFPDIAIGAPGASIGSQINAGAVYVVSGAVLRTPRVAAINLATVGQTGASTTAGVIFAGANTGDRAGSSVDTAGNVDGDRTSVNQQIPDFLIGSPAAVGAGRAALIYGAINLATLATNNGGVNSILLSQVGDTSLATATVPGALFNASGTGDLTGFSVSTAGDFNADGLSDFMIGSPGFTSGTGSVSLIYGRGGTTTGGRIVGTFTLGALPATVPSVQINGASTGALAGFSISEVGRINADAPNEILVGSPGFNNNSGAAYLIPGNLSLFGTHSLAGAETSPLFGTQMTVSGSATAAALGSSVSGRLTQIGQTRTLDNDLIADMFIGATGLGISASSVNAGGVFALEGAFVPLQTVPDLRIQTTISITSPVNATTPAALPITVFSNNTITPPFRPATEIDPTSIVVNGVAFPTATVTATGDLNGDGIPEAIVTITPRADLNLQTGQRTITLTGRTLATAGSPNTAFTGTTTVTVVGGGGNNNGGPASGPPQGVIASTVNTLDFGERFVPTPSTFSRFNYKPIPVNVATRQFLPARGFAARIGSFYGAKVDVPRPYSLRESQYRTSTLGKGVFTRGNIKRGQDVQFTHKVPVVPRRLQSQGFPRNQYNLQS